MLVFKQGVFNLVRLNGAEFRLIYSLEYNLYVIRMAEFVFRLFSLFHSTLLINHSFNQSIRIRL